MSIYHFPVLFGEHRTERVVMIHLTNNESDIKNRVIITKGSNDQPLFRIPNEVKLIDNDYNGVDPLMDVDFMGWYEIEEKRLKHEGSIKKVKRQIDNLRKKTQLTTSDQKRYESLLAKLKDLEDYDIDGDIEKMKGKLKGKNVLKVESGGTVVEVKEEGDYYEYYVKDNKKGNFESDIVFGLMTNYDPDEESVVFQGKTHVVRPLDEDVVKINVDLGSDATQVNFFTSKSGIGTQPVDLVKSLMDLYTDRKYNDLTVPTSSEPLFIQQEKKHPEYYKTGNITFQNAGRIDEDITNSDTFINYLNVSTAGKNVTENQKIKADTWDKESKFDKKLINIKMLYANMRLLGGYLAGFYYQKNDSGTITKCNLSDQIKLLEVLRFIYRQILKATTQSIGGHKYYSVLLLVPNIYVQINIDHLLSELNEKFNDLSQDNAVRYDFRVISESDAAFAGVKLAKIRGGSVLEKIVKGETDPKQKDMFLIIDSGKGTTDYSIVRYDKASTVNNSMSSIVRDGIVGAGGSIDYVFARVFARQVYVNMVKTTSTIAEEEFIRRFLTMIHNLDPVYQDTMMLMVEMLKKEYRYINKKGKTAKVYPCFEQGEPKIIINNLVADKVNYNNINGAIDSWKEIAKWEWDKTLINTDEKDNAEVKWVCNAIADAIITRVFDDNPIKLTNQIDYVIFTGRSFLFEPLKKAFVERIQPHRGVFPVNYEYPLFFVKLKSKFSKEKKELENLKVAPVQDFDMKAISVDFAEHDLGMNCNSDLCCVDMLNVCGEDGQPIFKQDLFWKGFTTNINDQVQKCFYIGYPTKSFTPDPLQQMRIRRNPYGDELSLVNMTLFPVYYVNVDLDTQTTLGNSKSQNQNRDGLVDSDDHQTPPQSDGEMMD